MTIHSVYGPDGNRIAEYNEATGALIREYIWLEGAPVAVVEGGVISFVRSDHIGRPVFATNSSGVKTWTAAYLPFGGVRVSTGTPPTARFPGQWFQSETGLHQNWMRDYDPTTGRYMQADPLGLVDGASVYGYARQSPGRYIDPRGEQISPPVSGPLLGPRLGPLFGPRFGPRFGPLGPFDVPPLIMPRDDGSDDEGFITHPRAQEQYRRYKNYCGNPPPPTGDRCTDLLRQAEFMFQCANMREAWDDEWLPGRHRTAISELRRGAQNRLALFGMTCASCEAGDAEVRPLYSSMQQ